MTGLPGGPPAGPPGARDFARSYLTHVALGEGCNCAEAVLRLRHGTWRAPECLRAVFTALRARIARQ